jgi:hypothetical protein
MQHSLKVLRGFSCAVVTNQAAMGAACCGDAPYPARQPASVKITGMKQAVPWRNGEGHIDAAIIDLCPPTSSPSATPAESNTIEARFNKRTTSRSHRIRADARSNK